jgi:hypothetical protein
MGWDPVIGFGISLAVSAISSLFVTPQKTKKQETSLRVPRSEYDSPLPKIYGKIRLEGNKFWPEKIDQMYRRETETTSQGGKGGGGGGKGGQKTETEKIFGTWAVLFCEGDVSIERVIINGQEFTTDHPFFQEYCTFFDGTQTQAWSAIQTIETGDEAEIAYKGVCYIGFRDVPLEVYGNQIPTQIGAVLLGEDFGANPDVSLVVRDICERAGVPSDKIDVTDITGKYVLNEGLLVSQNGESSRKVLEELMQFYLFTAVETAGGVIAFKTYDQGVFTPNTFPTEHYLAVNENRIFDVVRTSKSQLPNKASVRFYNNNQKYDADTIIEYFEEFTQENDFRIETQISTNPYEARQQGRKILKFITSRQRYNYTFKLPAVYYPFIELLGVYELPNGEVIQVDKLTLNPDYTIDVSARRYTGVNNFIYDPPNPPANSSIPSLIDPLDNGIPDVYFLDIPVINPNNPPNTIYICASAPTTVNISFDGGNTYVTSVNHAATSTIGECETALPSASGLDTINTLNVQLFTGSLSNISVSQFNTGSNLALIANQNNGIWEGELIRFRDVLPLGGDRYTISYLQRGDFNTNNFSSNNQVGSKFFLLKGNGAYYSVYANTTNVGQPISFQPIIAPWQNLGTTPVITVNTVGNNYIPLAPVNIDSQIDEADNITITWDYPFLNNSPFQNGTETISYEIDILNGLNTVVRSFSTSSLNVTYFYVDQQSDGIILPFNLKVYRVSSIVGRGYAGDATISLPTSITGITGNIDADTFNGELPAFYLDRANHTGTQTIITISGLQNALDALQPLLVNQVNIKSINNNTLLGTGNLVIDSTNIPNFNESIDDRVASLLVAGSNIDLIYNDILNTLTINATGSGTGLDVVTDGTTTVNNITQLTFSGASVINSGSGIATINVSITGDMLKSIYDTNNDGVVNLAQDLAGIIPANKYYGTDSNGFKGFFTFPTGLGTGDMTKAIYDTNNNGIVDFSSDISGSTLVNQYYGTNASNIKGFYNLPPSGGDMTKAIYDTNDNGIVDLAENINGSTLASYYYGTNASNVKGFYSLPLGGDMLKSIYDTTNNGKVDIAELADLATNIVGSPSITQYYGTDSLGVKGFFNFPTGSGIGDMNKSTYDINNNGIVDSAESISGSTSLNQYYGTNASNIKGFYNLPVATGDMLKSTYDTTNNGRVDIAELADLATNVVGSPSVTQYYGTDINGVKGFFNFPIGNGIGDMNKSVYDPNNDGIVNFATNISGTVGTNQYYGSDAGGIKGFYNLPSSDITLNDGVSNFPNIATVVFNNATITNLGGNTASVALASSGIAWGLITGTLSTQTDLQNALNAKQNTLVNQTNIKSINNNSLLGSGNLQINYNDLSNRPVTAIIPAVISSNTTLAETDYNKFIRATGAITITLPNGLSTGFTCTIQNTDTTVKTFVASGTLDAAGSTLVARYATAQVLHLGSNIWTIVGALT